MQLEPPPQQHVARKLLVGKGITQAGLRKDVRQVKSDQNLEIHQRLDVVNQLGERLAVSVKRKRYLAQNVSAAGEFGGQDVVLVRNKRIIGVEVKRAQVKRLV